MEVETVLDAIRSVFDRADSLAIRAYAILYDEFGEVPATTTQVERQMIVLGRTEGMIGCSTTPEGLLSAPLIAMAAGFVIENWVCGTQTDREDKVAEVRFNGEN